MNVGVMVVVGVVVAVAVVAVGAVALMRAMSRSKKVQRLAAVVNDPKAAVVEVAQKAVDKVSGQ